MFHCLPESAWADGSLAEAAVQLGKMVGHRNQSQPNAGLNSLGHPVVPLRIHRRPALLRSIIVLTSLMNRGLI